MIESSIKAAAQIGQPVDFVLPRKALDFDAKRMKGGAPKPRAKKDSEQSVQESEHDILELVSEG